MNFLDRIALNRLIAIITSFILGLLKLIVPHNKTETPKRQRRLVKRKTQK